MEAILRTEEELMIYLSLDDLRKMEEMIIQTMQEHKVELEASPLHMVMMIECANKDIEEFPWVLSEGMTVRSVSSKSVQSISDDEPAEEQEPTHDSEKDKDEKEKSEEQQ